MELVWVQHLVWASLPRFSHLGRSGCGAGVNACGLTEAGTQVQVVQGLAPFFSFGEGRGVDLTWA